MLGSAMKPSVPSFGRNSVLLCFQNDCQGSKCPPEPLTDQHGWCFWRFGPGDGFLVVGDPPAKPPNSYRQVGVFCHRVRGNAAGIFNGFSAPRARARVRP